MAGVDLIFKIAAIGILIAVLYQLLEHSGRKEYALLTAIMGMIVVISIVVQQIGYLFDTIKSIFGL